MENIYLSPEFKSHWRNLTSKLTPDQLMLIEFMEKNIKGNICMPTGAGKGVVMRYDILNQIQKPTNDVFAIVSHR